MVADKPAHTDDDVEPPDDDDDFAGADDPKARGFASKVIGDLAKRALMTGIGAVFVSEETLRGQLSDMKLPKEAMHAVAAQADKTKREIVAAIARETREFLSKLEVDKVLARALVGTTVEIQTRIRVLPKEGGGVTTEVEHSDMAVVPTTPTTPATTTSSEGDAADESRSSHRKRKKDRDG